MVFSIATSRETTCSCPYKIVGKQHVLAPIKKSGNNMFLPLLKSRETTCSCPYKKVGKQHVLAPYKKKSGNNMFLPL